MLETDLLPQLLGLLALSALVAYAVLGGADFGGGVWTLGAFRARDASERRAIAAAMGPVWEANHVWLVFVIVILFTCYPAAFAALSVAFFWPFHLVLAGIVLRGAAFVFRAHGREAAETPMRWGGVFGVGSVITPVLLGACLGAVSTGEIRLHGGALVPGADLAWLGPFPLATAALALSASAYLAAVYLTLETEGEMRERFRRRAIGAWLVAGLVSLGTLTLASSAAPRLWAGLTGPAAGPVVIVGLMLAPAPAFFLLRRRYRAARGFAISQVAVLLAGWGLAQWPHLVYPDFTLASAAAPTATLELVLWSLPFGLGLLLPSLWLLFTAFKARNPAADRLGESAGAEPDRG